MCNRNEVNYQKMKNIVLLITDTFRYDNLGERARRPIRTPMLDKFEAERATAIDKFYMSSFPTVPHRTDIMTGNSRVAPLSVATHRSEWTEHHRETPERAGIRNAAYL